MSAVGIQYDARYDAGARQQYAWSQFEMHDSFSMPQEMNAHMAPEAVSPYQEPKLLQDYKRSLSESSPKPMLSPEQRELKRQRDEARRNSKAKMRRDRSPSHPYTLPSQSATPDLMPRSLPEYASSIQPSPVLSQSGLPQSAGFLSSFSHPGSEGPGAPGPHDVYTPMYAMGPNDYQPIPSYTMPYPTQSTEVPIPSPYLPQRSHTLSSLPDLPSSLYQNSQTPSMSPSLDARDNVRLVHSRPKPQCWEHGCNGRQFSTFSNLLRHQREKSGVATKSSCPNCGAEFTRTTARNGHMAHDKCKPRRAS